jgi:hypothetical protein
MSEYNVFALELVRALSVIAVLDNTNAWEAKEDGFLSTEHFVNCVPGERSYQQHYRYNAAVIKYISGGLENVPDSHETIVHTYLQSIVPSRDSR